MYTDDLLPSLSYVVIGYHGSLGSWKDYPDERTLGEGEEDRWSDLRKWRGG